MKVHNYSNDYAAQRKADEQPVKDKKEEAKDAGNEAEPTAKEAAGGSGISEKENTPSESPSKGRKKKASEEQQQPSSQKNQGEVH